MSPVSGSSSTGADGGPQQQPAAAQTGSSRGKAARGAATGGGAGSGSCASREWLYALVTFPDYFTPCRQCCTGCRTPKREQLLTLFDTQAPHGVFCSHCPEFVERGSTAALLQVRGQACWCGSCHGRAVGAAPRPAERQHLQAAQRGGRLQQQASGRRCQWQQQTHRLKLHTPLSHACTRGRRRQVRRSSFKNVVNAVDIVRFGADTSGVQHYTLNSNKVRWPRPLGTAR